MYNQKQKSNVHLRKKNTKQLTVRGGGVNPYGQPDRKISVFFLTASLIVNLEQIRLRNSNVLTSFPVKGGGVTALEKV